MAATNVQLNVTGNALSQLQKIEKGIGKVSSNFLGLRNVLGGLALGNFATNAFRMADAIDDVAQATGLATNSVIGFGQAISQNGGNINEASNLITKFGLSLGEATNGSKTAITAFNEVGISISDLASLTDEQIFAKVLDGLAKITDKSTQARLATELLGKAAKGIDFSNVSADFQKASEEALKYVQSNKSAAAASDNLAAISAKLQNELLLTLKPISDLVAKIDASSESFTRFLNAIKNVIIVLTAIFGIILPLGRAFLALRAGAAVAAEAVATIAKEFPRFLTSIKGWLTNFPKIGTIISNGIKKATDALKTANDPKDIAKLQQRLEYWQKISAAFEAIKKTAAGAATAIISVGAALIGYNKEEEVPVLPKGPQGPRVLPQAERERIRTQAAERLKLLNKAYAEGVEKVDQYTASLQRELDAMVESIALQKDAFLISEDELEIKKAQLDVTNKLSEAQEKYKDMLAGLDPTNENDRKLIGYIEQQIAALKEKEVVSKQAAKTAIEDLQKLRNAQEAYTRSIEDTTRAIQQNEALTQLQEDLDLIGLYGVELEKQTSINEINRDLRQQMVDLSLELLKIDGERTRIGEQNYQIERQRIIQQMQDAQELRDARVKAVEEEQSRKLELENSYYEGAKKALEDMADQFKPINIAQDAIKRGFDTIGDAVEQFVETGKFNFKDFARSVLADLAKMLAKAALFKALSATLGFFGLSIPGLAEGGPAKKGQPYLVGEKGPELFVPRESGTVVPNNRMNDTEGSRMVNAPVTNNYITNNINALDAKSVAQLFAENRKALLGSVRTAEKELPYRA